MKCLDVCGGGAEDLRGLQGGDDVCGEGHGLQGSPHLQHLLIITMLTLCCDYCQAPNPCSLIDKPIFGCHPFLLG